jgi:hypothetical protein
MKRHRTSPAIVISFIALIVAMGGTGYAAISIPRNSVGSAQLRNGAVTNQKIAGDTLGALKGARGPAGATGHTGATGPAGQQGATGAPGPEGLLGPTSGTSAGSVEELSSTGFTPFGSSGTVTLLAAGKVLVEVSGFYFTESVADRKLAVLGGGLGERLLQCALAAGLARNRQLRGPSGDAADERCGALAARDLYRCTLTELSQQPGAVLLR